MQRVMQRVGAVNNVIDSGRLRLPTVSHVVIILTHAHTHTHTHTRTKARAHARSSLPLDAPQASQPERQWMATRRCERG
jgi:hypothetical protein